MSEKPGFMIRHKHMRALFSMSDKDIGALMRLLYAVSVGEEPEPPQKPAMRVAFEMMAEDVREDTKKYADKVEKATRASHSRSSVKDRTISDDIERYQTISNNNNNTIHTNNKNNNNTALNYPQRDDDLDKQVLADM